MALPAIAPLREDDLAFLRCVDSPTVANAIELFTRPRPHRGLHRRLGARLFPGAPPLVGAALTVTMATSPGPVKSGDGFWRMWDALAAVRRRRSWSCRTAAGDRRASPTAAR